MARHHRRTEYVRYPTIGSERAPGAYGVRAVGRGESLRRRRSRLLCRFVASHGFAVGWHEPSPRSRSCRGIGAGHPCRPMSRSLARTASFDRDNCPLKWTSASGFKAPRLLSGRAIGSLRQNWQAREAQVLGLRQEDDSVGRRRVSKAHPRGGAFGQQSDQIAKIITEFEL